MSVPWTTSATALVRAALSTRRYLKTPDIWALGTAGERPVLQPGLAFTQDGRIRMRRAANMREGKRAWVPPPVKPLPEHPFQSVRFLKRTILASLEAQGLIHKTPVRVPITSAADVLEAERAAARLYRRQVLEAKRENRAPPRVPPAPATTKKEFYWTLGARRVEREKEKEKEKEKAEKVGEAGAVQSDEVQALSDPGTEAASAEAVAGIDEAAWARAEQLEAQLHAARLVEEEQIAVRKEARKVKFAAEREREKARRAADVAAGRVGARRQEARRRAALEGVERYAAETGEDVSAWIEELEGARLGTAEPEPLPQLRPVPRSRIDGRLRLTPMPARKRSPRR